MWSFSYSSDLEGGIMKEKYYFYSTIISTKELSESIDSF